MATLHSSTLDAAAVISDLIDCLQAVARYRRATGHTRERLPIGAKVIGGNSTDPRRYLARLSDEEERARRLAEQLLHPPLRPIVREYVAPVGLHDEILSYANPEGGIAGLATDDVHEMNSIVTLVARLRGLEAAIRGSVAKSEREATPPEPVRSGLVGGNWTKSELCEIAGVSESTFDRVRKAAGVAAAKPGDHSHRFSRAELRRMAEAATEPVSGVGKRCREAGDRWRALLDSSSPSGPQK